MCLEVLKSAIFVTYQQVATYDQEDELLSKEQKIIREDNISKENSEIKQIIIFRALYGIAAIWNMLSF